MSEVEVKRSKSISAVWVIPIVSLLIGIGLVVQNLMGQGPRVKVVFATAEGIQAGETRVKLLSVDLGVVKSVYINAGYKSITAELNLDHGTEELLREDTRFWVVKPRIGTTGVSGLGTLLSGAYIELAPGIKESGRREFVGLETVPLTPASAPGVHLSLNTSSGVSVSAGSPVLYNGFRVGRIEEATLSVTDGKTYYKIFIDAPYDDLITTATRFWNASGVQIDAGTQGISLRTESLEAVLTGGIAFALPEGSRPGMPVENDHEFILYESYADIIDRPFEYGREYLLLFNSSVRGLKVGAPVEYRGLRLGTVLDISFDLLPENSRLMADGKGLIPVLIRIDPGRIGSDEKAEIAKLEQVVESGVNNGMRASLATGSLLTGSLYVSLDFHDDVPSQALTRLGNFTVLPTIGTELDRLQAKISAMLDKFNELPIEKTVEHGSDAMLSLKKTLDSANTAVNSMNRILKSGESVPTSLNIALEDFSKTMDGIGPESVFFQKLSNSVDLLTETLESAKVLLETLNAKPNSLIFPEDKGPDIQPRVPR